MAKIVIVGGGWAGVSAGIAARKAGAEEVVLLERTDLLLGTGLVGGIMRNNGRFTAAEELIALGGGELICLTDQLARHRNLDFPGHRHATLYDVIRIEPIVKKYLIELGVEVKLRKRVKDIWADEGKLKGVITADEEIIPGDVFIDTTGSAGPQKNCNRYGNGCAMCIIRCPSFGPRVSIVSKMGIKEKVAGRTGGVTGAISGSCKLNKESLAGYLKDSLNRDGMVMLKIPAHLQKNKDGLAKKACQQYTLREYFENLVILDTGHAKLMTPFFPLEQLREIKGLELARYEDPYAGGIGNSIRFLALAPRDNTMKVRGAENLFCGGEKAGLYVGHTEAMVTGTLAGYNATQWINGKELLELPRSLAIGEFIAFGGEQMINGEVQGNCTFSGSKFFERMKALALYSLDVDNIQKQVKRIGLMGVFGK